MWELQCKEKEFSLEAGITKGRPLPEWFLDEPPLYPGDDFFLSAFYELSCGDPIRWVDRIMYAERKGLDPDVADAFSHIISGLDSAYIKWKTEKEKALNKNTVKKGKR